MQLNKFYPKYYSKYNEKIINKEDKYGFTPKHTIHKTRSLTKSLTKSYKSRLVKEQAKRII